MAEGGVYQLKEDVDIAGRSIGDSCRYSGYLRPERQHHYSSQSGSRRNCGIWKSDTERQQGKTAGLLQIRIIQAALMVQA